MTEVLAQLQTWQATVVALLGAILWALPIKGRWPLWHHSIGLLLALLAGVVSAVVAGTPAALVEGALQGMIGLSVSWVLIEAGILGLAARDAVRSRYAKRGQTIMEPDIDVPPDESVPQQPSDVPKPAEEEPPPIYPPPPVKQQ